MSSSAGRGTASRAIPPVLSIDVEEYFQVVNLEGLIPRQDWPSVPSRVEVGLDRLLGLLAESGASATCFVLGCVAERNPAAIRRLAEAGLEIASHGYDHRRLHELGAEALDRDLARTEEAIGNACGVRVLGYRAPYFSLDRRTLWALDVLLDRGYRYDSSLFPGHHPGYGMPDGPDRPFAVLRPDGRTIAELPIGVAKVGGVELAAGGAYFRLFPYRLTRFALRRLARPSPLPFTFYVHPWELDPEQPRLALPWWRRRRQYQGLATTEPKLRRLLGEMRFTDAATALDALDEGELEAIALEPSPPLAAAGESRPGGPPIGVPAHTAELMIADGVARERRRSSRG